jgi:hypothetical protein
MSNSFDVFRQNILEKGTRHDPNTFIAEQITRIQSLPNPIRDLFLILFKKHPDFPHEQDYYDRPAKERLKQLVENYSEYFDHPDWQLAWNAVLPNAWKKDVAAAWNRLDSDRRTQIWSVLSQDWLYHEVDLSGLVEYAPWAWHSGRMPILELPALFIAALDNEHPIISEQIKNILQNQAATGAMSNIFIFVSMQSNRADFWSEIQRLLIAAQRQDGLRQMIILNLPLSHQGCKTLIYQTILEQDLIRFKSVSGHLVQWLDLPVADGKPISDALLKQMLGWIVDAFTNTPFNNDSFENQSYLEIYARLWAIAQVNPVAFEQYCLKLMQSDDAQHRALTLYLLKSSQKLGFEIAVQHLHETNILVRWQIFNRLRYYYGTEVQAHLQALWDFCERQATEPTVKQPVPSFSWQDCVWDANAFFGYWIQIARSDPHQLKYLYRYQNRFNNYVKRDLFRVYFHNHLYPQPNEPLQPFLPDAFERNWVVSQLQDKFSYDSKSVFQLYDKLVPTASELVILRKLLTRKTDDLRKKILDILTKLPDEAFKTNVQALLNASNEDQVVAALDLLQQAKKQFRLVDFGQEAAISYQAKNKISPKAALILQDLVKESNIQYDASNGWGLYNRQAMSPIQPIVKPTRGFFVERMYRKPFLGFSMDVEAVRAELRQLDGLFYTYREHEYQMQHYSGELQTLLLGNVLHAEVPFTTFSLESLPLKAVWLNWRAESQLTDLDLYLLTTPLFNYQSNLRYNYSHLSEIEKQIPDWFASLIQDYKQSCEYSLIEALPLTYRAHCKSLLSCLIDRAAIAETVTELNLDLTAHYFASIPQEHLNESLFKNDSSYAHWDYTWRDIYAGSYTYLGVYQVDTFSEAQFKRCWSLYYWYYRNLPEIKNSPQPYQRNRINLFFHPNAIGQAYEWGLINHHVLYDLVLKTQWSLLVQQKNPDLDKTHEKYPIFKEIMGTIIPRFLDIELKRADSPTSVSDYVSQLSAVYGLSYFVKIVKGLNKDTLHRGYFYGAMSKSAQLSRLLKNTFPLPEESFESFQQAIQELSATFKTKDFSTRLLQIALYAPQWLSWTEQYLELDGLESAAWCLHAHSNSYFDVQKSSELAKYSTVSAEDFKDGAVDVIWFQTAAAKLGEKRFQQVYDAAHYICDAQGYIRARLYADAILGKLSLEACQQRVLEKRHKDYVTAIGLIPLRADDKTADILTRYQLLQRFQRESKAFGQQRQASEKRVVDLAMDNLARNAGYPDPIRLTWAMELIAYDYEKLKALIINDVTIRLEVDEMGKAFVTAEKNGKKLSSIPAKLKQEPVVIECIEVKNHLNVQHSRVKKALEDAMIRGDVFERNEFEKLLQHPVIGLMLKKLIGMDVVNNRCFWISEAADNLPNSIRIAHCYDLYASGEWSNYQRTAFQQRIIQPFKQIFRELYLPTADELRSKTTSDRYKGYQVQTQRAGALFRTRGWSAYYSEAVQKTFHQEGIIATMYGYANWYDARDNTPTELEWVHFRKKNQYMDLPLAEVPPRLFSEVMRDIDLVVSVAHVGGVDIETSLSSIELRRVILEETALLFRVDNVRTEKNHLFIQGSRANYNIHLGSGIVYQEPTRMLYVRAISTDERGKIFLPFADEDPKTAEIVSKMLLFAQDSALQDPTILAQIMR